MKDIFPSFDGGVITAEQRNVDQSIQPGDGGWGVILDVSAFKRIKRTTAFFSGTYVITPEEKSGVRTFRSRPSEAIMSIADQYLARLGAAYDLFPEWGVSTLLALRAEGVPVRDLFGGSRGFRRPGVAVSIEPGLVFSKEGWTASLSTPVAIYRNRQRSVPDEEETERTGDFRHGDAAFADFMVLFTLGKRF